MGHGGFRDCSALPASGDDATKGQTTGLDYVAELGRMLREWNWPDWSIEVVLPKIVDVLVGLGILERVSGGYEPTSKAESPAAWTAAWALLGEEGIDEDIAPAS